MGKQAPKIVLPLSKFPTSQLGKGWFDWAVLEFAFNCELSEECRDSLLNLCNHRLRHMEFHLHSAKPKEFIAAASVVRNKVHEATEIFNEYLSEKSGPKGAAVSHLRRFLPFNELTVFDDKKKPIVKTKMDEKFFGEVMGLLASALDASLSEIEREASHKEQVLQSMPSDPTLFYAWLKSLAQWAEEFDYPSNVFTTDSTPSYFSEFLFALHKQLPDVAQEAQVNSSAAMAERLKKAKKMYLQVGMSQE